jgi:Do/DeqQ family serine protease
MRPVRFLSSLIAALLVAGAAHAQAPGLRMTPADRPQIQLSFAPVVKRVTPAVVNVYASRQVRQASNPLFDDPIFRRFFGGGDQPGSRNAQSLGSGVLVDASGLVVTNHHVIEGMTDVKVALTDKREFDAEVVLRDPRTDLAVLKLKTGSNFPFLDMGDSDGLEVGDLVLAVGNPFGVGQTVTQGIVSAVARTQVGITDYGFFIQTDAAINPGNSGGALVDMAGRLVGINSAIYSRSGGSIGIGFAIPANMVKVVVATAKGGGKQVKRPWVGATVQQVSREIAESLGLDRPTGALVADVAERSPVAEAGLRRGDIVTAIDGLNVDDPESFGYRLATRQIGGTSQFTIMRDGRSRTLAVKLVAAPENPPREALKLAGRSPFTGATVMNMSPAVAEEFSIEGVREGVVVTEVPEDSIAARFGVQKGDVILAINEQKISRTADVQKATAARANFWRLSINRGGQVINTVIGG